MQSQLSVLVQQLHQGLAVDEVHLAWTHSFCRHFVWRSENYRAQSQRFAGPGHLQDKDFAVARSDREFDLARAKYQHAARRLALHKQDRTPWIGAQMAGRAE